MTKRRLPRVSRVRRGDFDFYGDGPVARVHFYGWLGRLIAWVFARRE